MKGAGFIDTIDGYFPLQVSLCQMMARRGLDCAALHLSFAPILDVPGLPATAPVPLNIRAGRAGMITEMRLLLREGGARITGYGVWHWFDAGPAPPQFDPATRLAEPAIIEGRALAAEAVASVPDTPIAGQPTQALAALLRNGTPPHWAKPNPSPPTPA